jgi:hypothetical protein
VPNNIVRPTYLDLISNRFIATSLRLVSAEKFDLDPSAEKSYSVCGRACVCVTKRAKGLQAKSLQSISEKYFLSEERRIEGNLDFWFIIYIFFESIY